MPRMREAIKSESAKDPPLVAGVSSCQLESHHIPRKHKGPPVAGRPFDCPSQPEGPYVPSRTFAPSREVVRSRLRL